MGIIGAYRRAVPNSYAHAAIMGAGGGGLGYLSWRPLVEIGASLARPLAAAANGGSLPRDFDREVEELKRDRAMKIMSAAILALASASTTLLADYRPNQVGGGLGAWDADRLYEYGNRFDSFGTLYKSGSVSGALMRKKAEVDGFLAYSPGAMDVNYAAIVNTNEVNRLLDKDPFLSDMDYARNSAKAIVNNAAMMSGTAYPTYGQVYDSAVNKFENSLSFSGVAGVAGVAAKTAIANGLSNLFTGALGAVMDLPENMRNNIVSAGTWAGALGAIFQ